MDKDGKLMHLVLCILLILAFVPAVHAELPAWVIDSPRAAGFEMPDKFDGFAGGDGCHGIVLPRVDRAAQLLVSQGVGETLIMHGDQVPHWTTTCKYADRDYIMTEADYRTSDNAANGNFRDPFTSFMHITRHHNTNPFSTNPFEYMGSYPDDWRGRITILTDQGYRGFGISTYGAMVVVPHYRPLDSTLNLNVEGIHSPSIDLKIRGAPNFFEFDAQKYDGGILVNGKVTPIGPADHEWLSPCSRWSSSANCLSVMVNMTEHGWPELSHDEILEEASEWYHQLYDQDYLKEYGQIPEPDYEYHLRYTRPDAKGLVTYHNATLEIEIPLKMNDNYTYTKNYPEVGWCRAPMVLVAKSSEDPHGACVMPDTAQTLMDRKWAQKTPELSEQKRKEFAKVLAYYGLQYVPGTADPHDAFRAALLGMPHVDDVHVLETTPGFSYRDKDYALHYDRTVHSPIKYLNELTIHPLGAHYLWNSPEPVDDEIVCMKKTSNYKYPDETCPPSDPALLISRR